MHTRLVIVLALLAVFSCSRGPLEETVDGEAICRDHCEHWLGCGRAEASPSCFEACMDNNRRGWEGQCQFKREAYLSCLTDLSCDQLDFDVEDTDVPQSERPCTPPRHEYSVCTSEHDK